MSHLYGWSNVIEKTSRSSMAKVKSGYVIEKVDSKTQRMLEAEPLPDQASPQMDSSLI